MLPICKTLLSLQVSGCLLSAKGFELSISFCKTTFICVSCQIKCAYITSGGDRNSFWWSRSGVGLSFNTIVSSSMLLAHRTHSEKQRSERTPFSDNGRARARGRAKVLLFTWFIALKVPGKIQIKCFFGERTHRFLQAKDLLDELSLPQERIRSA